MSCTDYSGEFWKALEPGTMAVRDAVLCPYQTSIGGPLFATIVLLGIINIPIYIRQDSAIMPFVLTMIIGGVVLAQSASVAQGILVAVVLFAIGLGPILVLRRIQPGL